MFEQKQKVIVVKGEGKEKKYAQMLVNILSTFQDISLSEPMTESEYNKSFVTAESGRNPKIPSGKIIFWGNGKEAKLQSKSINWQFDRFGMKYGWMGNRCVVTSEADEISLEEQSAFADYYNSKIEEFRPLIETLNINLSDITYSEVEHLDMNEIYDEIRWEKDDEVSDKVAKTVATVVLSPLILLAKGLKGVGDTIQDAIAISERKDIWKHQYQLLVLEFAFNGLSRFMDNLNKKEVKGKVTIVYDIKDAEYAHLLHNLIQQHSGYDAMEFTEKMFIDNASKFSADNKIIFCGKTKASKERWNDMYKYTYDENGMRYGWFGNNAFINVRRLKNKAERTAFINAYNKKRKSYADAAKSYSTDNNFEYGKKFAAGLNIVNGVLVFPKMFFGLPSLVIGAGVYAASAGVRYGIGAGVDSAVNSANAVADLTGYQYQLLLREFVFNGFEKFMEG